MTGYVLVCVSGNIESPLNDIDLSSIHNFLSEKNIAAQPPKWLHPQKAAEIEISNALSRTDFEDLKNIHHHRAIDIFQTPSNNRRKKLCLADMDATIVAGETLDDLAAHAGVKDKISAITERAMRGELDFEDALKARVKMLKDLPLSALTKTLSQMTLNKGAIEAIKVMRHHGAECYLVSGGFTFFTSAITEICGFNGHHGNQLDIINDILTGEILPPILGKETKLSLLHHYTKTLNLSAEDTLTVGDGANDIPMLQEAGLGVGYYPKPLVKEAILNHIVHTDLTSLLYIQGYTWQDIAI